MTLRRAVRAAQKKNRGCCFLVSGLPWNAASPNPSAATKKKLSPGTTVDVAQMWSPTEGVLDVEVTRCHYLKRAASIIKTQKARSPKKEDNLRDSRHRAYTYGHAGEHNAVQAKAQRQIPKEHSKMRRVTSFDSPGTPALEELRESLDISDGCSVEMMRKYEAASQRSKDPMSSRDYMQKKQPVVLFPHAHEAHAERLLTESMSPVKAAAEKKKAGEADVNAAYKSHRQKQGHSIGRHEHLGNLEARAEDMLQSKKQQTNASIRSSRSRSRSRSQASTKGVTFSPGWERRAEELLMKPAAQKWAAATDVKLYP